MYNCTNCGAPIDQSKPFCASCGAPNPYFAPQNQQGQQNQQYAQNQQYQNQQYAQNQQYQYQQYGYGNPQYGYGNPQYRQFGGPVPPVSFGQKNIAVAIILSIVTLGIYGLIWYAKIVDQVNEASANQNGTSGGTVVLLTIVTCGIYGIVWFYKAGELINTAKSMRGLPVDTSISVIYLILNLFGLSIVACALAQSELNRIAEFHGAPRA